MKPITIFIEVDGDFKTFKWKPGYFKGWFKDGYFRRFYWLIFAIAFVRINLKDYNEYIASGRTQWYFKD